MVTPAQEPDFATAFGASVDAFFADVMRLGVMTIAMIALTVVLIAVSICVVDLLGTAFKKVAAGARSRSRCAEDTVTSQVVDYGGVDDAVAPTNPYPTESPKTICVECSRSINTDDPLTEVTTDDDGAMWHLTCRWPVTDTERDVIAERSVQHCAGLSDGDLRRALVEKVIAFDERDAAVAESPACLDETVKAELWRYVSTASLGTDTLERLDKRRTERAKANELENADEDDRCDVCATTITAMSVPPAVNRRACETAWWVLDAAELDLAPGSVRARYGLRPDGTC